MSLDKDANLDSRQVEDLRGRRRGRLGLPGLGSGRGGGMPIPIPRGKGGIGLVGLALFCLLGLLFAGGNAAGLLPELGEPDAPADDTLAETCALDNPDRFDDIACRNLLYVNSIQAYWETALPESFDLPYLATSSSHRC